MSHRSRPGADRTWWPSIQAGTRAVLSLVHDTWAELWKDHVPMVSAALSYYALFGLLPAIAAAAALWGQFGTLDALNGLTRQDAALLPRGMAQILSQFVGAVPRSFGSGLGLAVNIGFVLVTCYSAATGLISALNLVYERQESRSLLRCTLIATALGAAGIALLFAALVLVAAPPLVAPQLRPGPAGLLLWCRWPALAAAFVLGLLLLFRYAPDRGHGPSWRHAFAGAILATTLWMLTSALMSFYVANVADFGRLYGSLGGIAVVLLWFYASAFAVLVGAELDCVLSMRAGRPRTADPQPDRIGRRA